MGTATTTEQRRAQLPREDPLFWIPKIADRLFVIWMKMSKPFYSFGKGVRADRSCRIAHSATRYISVGDDVNIGRNVLLDVRSSDGRKSPILVIEKGCSLERRTRIFARNRIHLMPYQMIAHSVLIADHEPYADTTGGPDSFTGQPQQYGSVVIEEGCWVGFGVRIISAAGELRIGRNSVIGANAVIRTSVPAYSVVAGDPPCIVRRFDRTKGKWVAGYIRLNA